jgi:hypothetical protein
MAAIVPVKLYTPQRLHQELKHVVNRHIGCPAAEV